MDSQVPQPPQSSQSATVPANYYPVISIQPPQNPSRLFAIPFFGLMIKMVMIIPQAIGLYLMSIVYFFVVFIMNPFFVLFTGKYWDLCYDFLVALTKLSTKTAFFMYGVTDKYPGFDFQLSDFTLEIKKPENPNRLFAIPFFGLLARGIMIIPFGIFVYVIGIASFLGFFVAWVPVLFMGKYPETVFELLRDYLRLSLAATVYFTGLSDTYPSFSISMNHKTGKMIFIGIAVFFLLITFIGSIQASTQTRNQPPVCCPGQTVAPNSY